MNWQTSRYSTAGLVCVAHVDGGTYCIERHLRPDLGRPDDRAWYAVTWNGTPVASTLSPFAAKQVAETDNTARLAGGRP